MTHLKPTVFVVNHDVSARESLAPLIQGAGWQSEAFSDARAFLSQPRVPGPNCLVLDVDLPDINGLDLQTLDGGRLPRRSGEHGCRTAPVPAGQVR
jgi:FixJ family two-component response regulator